MQLDIKGKIIDTRPIANLLVQGEKGTTTLTMVSNRYYDNIDLGGLSWEIWGTYRSQDSTATLSVDKQYDEEQITLSVTLSEFFAIYPGAEDLTLVGTDSSGSQVLKLTGSQAIVVKDNERGTSSILIPSQVTNIEQAVINCLNAANAAGTAANAAGTAASEAAMAANQAAEAADRIDELRDSITAAANEAAKATQMATGAQTTAAEAQTTAAEAVETATAAKTTAQSAQSAANAASTAAGAAQSTADAAKTAAATAQSTADSAKSTADTVKSNLATNTGSATNPIYFSGGKPVKTTYELKKSVPSDAKFTDTTYSTGNASTSGLTKLYTGTGTATDGTMTQNAIKAALDGKLSTGGGTLSGNLTTSSKFIVGTEPSASSTKSGSVVLDGSVYLRSTGGNPAIRGFKGTGSFYQQLRFSSEPTGNFSLELPAGSGTLAKASSDVRLKTNIKKSTVNAIDTINRLRSVEYDWIDEAYSTKGKHWPVGLIADEMELVDPLLSLGGDSDDPEDYKSPNMWYLMGYLVKAVQELSAKVRELEERI